MLLGGRLDQIILKISVQKVYHCQREKKGGGKRQAEPFHGGKREPKRSSVVTKQGERVGGSFRSRKAGEEEHRAPPADPEGGGPGPGG